MIKTNKKTVYYEVNTNSMDDNTSKSIVKGDTLECVECFNINEADNKNCIALLKGSITILAIVKQLSNGSIEFHYKNESYKPKRVVVSDIEKLYLINSITRSGLANFTRATS